MIPEKYVEFCRALARVAREHNMDSLHGNFRPEFGDNWNEDINFTWKQGRHGEDSDELFVQSNVRVYTKLGPKK